MQCFVPWLKEVGGGHCTWGGKLTKGYESGRVNAIKWIKKKSTRGTFSCRYGNVERGAKVAF